MEPLYEKRCTLLQASALNGGEDFNGGLNFEQFKRMWNDYADDFVGVNGNREIPPAEC